MSSEIVAVHDRRRPRRLREVGKAGAHADDQATPLGHRACQLPAERRRERRARSPGKPGAQRLGLAADPSEPVDAGVEASHPAGRVVSEHARRPRGYEHGVEAKRAKTAHDLVRPDPAPGPGGNAGSIVPYATADGSAANGPSGGRQAADRRDAPLAVTLVRPP